MRTVRGVLSLLSGLANFLCTLVHGPGWDGARGIRDQDNWDDHAASIDRLVEEA